MIGRQTQNSAESGPGAPLSRDRLQGLLASLRSFRKLGPGARRFWDESIEEMFRRWQKVRSPQLALEIQPYDPAWPTLFEGERQRITALLGAKATDVQHIGSTSIPGLASKNIIDFFVALDVSATDPQTLAALAGYGYMDYGNSPIDRETVWLWRVEQGGAFVAHLCDHRRPWLQTAVNFRDYVRQHPAERDLYAETKRQLANRKDQSFLQYTIDKMLLWADIAGRANTWRGQQPEEDSASG